MNNFNYDGHTDGDWEDRGDLSWNEFDWQQFLRRQQKEIARFAALYDQHYLAPERLDLAARDMGWDVADWSLGEGAFDDEDERDDEPGDSDPYTLHRHPVFIVISSLLGQLRYSWEMVLVRRAAGMSAHLCWKYSESLSAIERQALLALQSLDMGDYLLCVVHLKHVLRSVNESLRLLPALLQGAGNPPGLLDPIRTRLFDIREVALRVMMECREEDRQGLQD